MWTRAAPVPGYDADLEVEILNAGRRAASPADVVDAMAERYLAVVQPHPPAVPAR
jgi:hypothetical protein